MQTKTTRKKATTATRKRTRKATTKSHKKATIPQSVNADLNTPEASYHASGNQTSVSSEDRALNSLKQQAATGYGMDQAAQPGQQPNEQLAGPQAPDQSPVLIEFLSDMVLMVSKRVLNIRGYDLRPLDETQKTNFNNYVSRPIVNHFMPSRLAGHPQLTAAFGTVASLCMTNVFQVQRPAEDEAKPQDEVKKDGELAERNNSDSGPEGSRQDIPDEALTQTATTPVNI